MQTSQQNPFVARLSPAQRQVLETIRNRSRARFGDDAFRMEDPPAEDPPKEDPPADLDKVELDKLPKEVQDIVKKYRKEAAEANGKAREEARRKAAEDATAEVTKKIAEALGLTKSETDNLTPEQLQQKLKEAGEQTTAAQEAAKQKDIELAVYRTASKAGGDPDALLDSRTFLEKVGKLDPSKSDFNDKVTEAIKDAVKNNSKLKPQAGAGSSSVDHGSGGSGDQGDKKPKSLTDAVGGHYGA